MTTKKRSTPGWGGKRSGAGRKPSAESGVARTVRPEFSRVPISVTIRMIPHAVNLRSRKHFTVLAQALVDAQADKGMRVCHFAVESNTIRLVVEAADKDELSRGMQGLQVRIARRLNRALGRTGSIFADRFEGIPLRTAAEVKEAMDALGDMSDSYSSGGYHGLKLDLGGEATQPATGRLLR